MSININRLPEEILLMIFRYIDYYRGKIRLERVCQRWRKIMLDHGWWKHVRQISLLNNEMQPLEPLEKRCGVHLVDCCFYKADIDSTLIRRIAENFPELKHLCFHSCKINELDENALELESFRALGARLRSLTFHETEHRPQLLLNPHLSHHFTRLRHFGLRLPFHHNIDPFPSHLRSLYLSTMMDFSLFSHGLEQMLARVHRDSPRLAALCFGSSIRFFNAEQLQQLMNRISDLKSLRFLRISFGYFLVDTGLVCSYLDNLPQLLALQLMMPIQQFSYVFRSPTFRSLIHLNLSLTLDTLDNCQIVGLLATVAPKLRSLKLDFLSYSLDMVNKIGCGILKIAQNGILEHLDMTIAPLTVETLGHLIRLCPNLHIFGVLLAQDEQLPAVAELRHIVGCGRSMARRHAETCSTSGLDICSTVEIYCNLLARSFPGHPYLPFRV